MFYYDVKQEKIIEIPKDEAIRQFKMGNFLKSRLMFYSVGDTPLDNGKYYVFGDTNTGFWRSVNTFDTLKEARDFANAENEACAVNDTDGRVYIYETKEELLARLELKG